jgi:hypothetical protein
MQRPVNEKDLGLEEAFEKIERLANALEEVNDLMEDLKENEGLDINLKIELK